MENDGAADADVTELHPRYSVEDQLACLERELRLRMRVYPPRVANGRMSADLTSLTDGLEWEISLQEMKSDAQH
jgi:hypothetical protein